MGNSGGGIDWDPSHSSMATGAGTPWSANNNTKPEAYLMGMLQDPVAQASGMIHDKFVGPQLSKWYGKDVPSSPSQQLLRDQGVAFDLGGTERGNRERDTNLANEATSRQNEESRQQQEQKKAADALASNNKYLTDQATAQSASAGEDAYLAARNAARKAKGNQIFGAYNG